MTIKVLLRSEGPGVVLFLLLATFITAVVTQKDDLVPDSDGRISDTIFNRTKREWREPSNNYGMPRNILYKGSETVYDGEPWEITCSNLWWYDEVEWTRNWNSLHREFRRGYLTEKRTPTSSTLYSTAGQSSDAGQYRCTSSYNYWNYYRLGYSPVPNGRTTDQYETSTIYAESDTEWTTEDPYLPFSDNPVSPADIEAESTRADNSICKPDANGTSASQSALESIMAKLDGIEELSSGIRALSANMTELSTQITQLIGSNTALNERFMSLQDTVIRASQTQNYTKLVIEANRGYDRRIKSLERRLRVSRRN